MTGNIAILCLIGIVVVYAVWIAYTSYALTKMDVEAGTLRREILVLGAKRHEEFKNMLVAEESLCADTQAGKKIVYFTNEFANAVKEHNPSMIYKLEQTISDAIGSSPYYKKLHRLQINEKWEILGKKNKEINERISLFPNRKVAQWLNISPGLLER